MKLKFITLLTIISITYLFLIRTINTFIPLLFTQEIIGKTIQSLSFIAHLIVLVFYLKFLFQYVPNERRFLYWASILSVVNAVLMSLLYFRGIILLFPDLDNLIFSNWPALFQIIHSPQYLLYSPFIGWINSLILLIFFIGFYQESPDIHRIPLQKATRYALGGSFVLLIVNSGLLTLQLFTGGMSWLLPYSVVLSLILLPIVTLVFITEFNFFLQFYRILEVDHSDQYHSPN